MNKDKKLQKKIELLEEKAIKKGWQPGKEWIGNFLQNTNQLRSYFQSVYELKGRLEKELEIKNEQERLRVADKKLFVEFWRRGCRTPNIFNKVSNIWVQDGHVLIEENIKGIKKVDVVHLSEVNYWKEIPR